MKKLLTVTLFLCLTQLAQGMFIRAGNPIKRTNYQESKLLFQKRVHCSRPSSNIIKISQQGYQDWQNINKDLTILRVYFEDVFRSIGEKNCPKVKPSDVLRGLRDKAREETKLHYVPIEKYMDLFIRVEDYNRIDILFQEKYNETKDVQKASSLTFDSFYENILQKSVFEFCKNMLKEDAAHVALDDKTIPGNGKTVIFYGNLLSDNQETREKTQRTLNMLLRE